jgi:hypothetical protein
MTKAPHIMTKPPHIMTKPPHIMKKAPHIMTKPPHIMTKPPHIMKKAPHIMTKAPHIMTINYLRQSWLSIRIIVKNEDMRCMYGCMYVPNLRTSFRLNSEWIRPIILEIKKPICLFLNRIPILVIDASNITER